MRKKQQYAINSLLLLCLMLAMGCTNGAEKAAKQPPNIVMVLVDDLGWADLACYGNTYHDTPHLDRLASEGMLFTQAYASASICSPTRSALLTGKSPARTGITDWIRAMFQGGDIPEDKTFRLTYTAAAGDSLLTPSNPLWLELDETTLAEQVKTKGYATAHMGKWHLGTEDWYPEKQGFDVNVGGCDYGQPPSYFDPYSNASLPGIPTLAPRREGEFLEDRLADEAVAFIIQNKDKPFFLNMNPYSVHTPIQGRADLVAKYTEKPGADSHNPTYAAMVESVDMLMGKILHSLDSLRLSENTIVIFTSDNGGLLPVTDNSPLRSGKGYPYEGGIRIPLIVRYPAAITPGTRHEAPVISHDWFPTICDILGLELLPNTVLDGVSLKQALFAGAHPERQALTWHFPHYRTGNVLPYSIIRKGDWKLIKWYQGKEFELYQLQEDPSEQFDLSATNPEKVKELNGELQRILAASGARMPRAKPAL
jgi:arylsulfatase A